MNPVHWPGPTAGPGQFAAQPAIRPQVSRAHV